MYNNIDVNLENNVTNYEERFLTLCDSLISRDGIEDLMKWLSSSDFYTAPASTRYHGSYAGGLLKHSLNVFDEFQRLLKVYPEVNCTPETAAIITLFHDITKVNMYKSEKRNRKTESGVWESYDAYTIDEKFKYGNHGGKSVFILSRFLKLTLEEAVAIQNHMGAFDNEHVGAVYAEHPLAWLLHVADESASYIIESN